jgi:hypothetical protein
MRDRNFKRATSYPGTVDVNLLVGPPAIRARLQ